MIIISIGLIILLAVFEYIHYIQVKDLLNRIMAKNYSEYKLIEEIQKEAEDLRKQESKQNKADEEIDLSMFEEDWSER